jgi:hypothetical protein
MDNKNKSALEKQFIQSQKNGEMAGRVLKEGEESKEEDAPRHIEGG